MQEHHNDCIDRSKFCIWFIESFLTSLYLNMGNNSERIINIFTTNGWQKDIIISITDNCKGHIMTESNQSKSTFVYCQTRSVHSKSIKIYNNSSFIQLFVSPMFCRHYIRTGYLIYALSATHLRTKSFPDTRKASGQQCHKTVRRFNSKLYYVS